MVKKKRVKKTQPELRFEYSGGIAVIQPLTKAGAKWVKTKLAYDPWQLVGGTGVAVERRMVQELVEHAVEDGLVV